MAAHSISGRNDNSAGHGQRERQVRGGHIGHGAWLVRFRPLSGRNDRSLGDDPEHQPDKAVDG